MHARWTIQHASYQPAGEDPDGYTVPESFADPVERLVYLIQPQRSEVPVGNDDLSLRVINSLVIGVPDVTLYKPGIGSHFPAGTSTMMSPPTGFLRMCRTCPSGRGISNPLRMRQLSER